MKTYKAWLIHNEEPESEWVPADVAKGLFDALADMVECFGDVSFPTEEEREADEDVIAARAALARAEGKGES